MGNEKTANSRRAFLKKASAAAAAGALPSRLAAASGREAGAGRVGDDDRPNILVIMSDEHNANVLGSAGDDVINTPNLDGLAERGISFDGAYCTFPQCAPSRASFTAGKYASRVSHWSNDYMLPSADYPTLPRIMNQAGYESYLCGKMHYDIDRNYGFEEPRPGLDTWMGRGWVKRGRNGRRAPGNLEPKPGISGRVKNARRGKSHVLSHDHMVTGGTVKFFRDRKPTDKPFFFLAGYVAPHFPLVVPHAYWRKYRGKVPMPKIPPGHLEEQPLNYKHLRIGFNVENIPPEITQRARELYYGLTEWVDNEIGKVLKGLEMSGLADNTVVIYTSDHGENMGEHGLWWKNCMYEHSARVPLIVSWPARWAGGQRRTEACTLLDVVQTIADLGGADVPDDWDGDSMVSWLDDANTSWKDRAVSEYYSSNVASGYAMIREGRYKYVYHTPPGNGYPAEHELYDLEDDPGEFNNLAGEPQHRERIEAMRIALVEEIGEHPDQTEARCRADLGGYDREWKWPIP